MKSPAECQTVAGAEDEPVNPPRRNALLALGLLGLALAGRARGAGMGGMARMCRARWTAGRKA